jgi:2-polyprenyl-6-methoxyphenol hydroxylase-like FAD-dependent oxidoreductase
MSYDVVIAGGGPVGLMLSCELKLAGVSVLVLERLADPDLPIKTSAVGARGLNITSAEAFYRRGLLPSIREAAHFWFQPGSQSGAQPKEASIPAPEEKSASMPPRFAGHFAGIMLNANLMDFTIPDFAHQTMVDPGPAGAGGMITMAAIERVLAEHAAKLGVVLRRGVEVTGFKEDADGVTVQTSEASIHAKWLIGCDGGRSVVRKLAGFEFPGTDPEITAYSAMVTLADPEKLDRGWKRTAKGLYLNGPMPGRLSTVEFDGPPPDRETPVTLEAFQASLRNVSGTNVTVTSMECATRYTDNARQASTYRKGRVLLAGDAAHVHSPFGGQGLNLGLGDAMNLGWKLAAVIQRWAAENLLDTYTAERHPIGAWVLDWTRAQVSILRPDQHARAMGAIVADLINTKAGTTYFAGKISGAWHRYNLPGDHRLIGHSAPDLLFEDGTRLGEFCRNGDAILFDPMDNAGLAQLAARWPTRLKRITTPCIAGSRDGENLTALFMRPDGCVAWVSEGEPDLAAAEAALTAWMGHSEA